MKLRNKAESPFLIFCKQPEFLIRHMDVKDILEVSDSFGAHLLAKYHDFLAEVKDEPKKRKASQIVEE